ncbi:MAG: 4Fe-4S dicluster domain-containing protein [Crenarchaeota archaeon]|nr:4Fe-4S dicluster domain-containing protein [Thermoproteota archaeon]
MKDIVGPLIEALKHVLKPRRLSVNFPDEYREIPENYRGVILFNYEKCVGCRQCVKICPADAIFMIYERGIYIPGVDYSRCIFCGLCADSCPTGALRLVRYQEIVVEKLDNLKMDPRDLFQGRSLEIVNRDRDGKEIMLIIDNVLRKGKSFEKQ